ncbi:MAG TPA: hypothetical protein VFT02_08825 [Pyrinomonadaceae bacterium]|nr:hypothetical protein [Pyrinomonadaceae bacterium]
MKTLKRRIYLPLLLSLVTGTLAGCALAPAASINSNIIYKAAVAAENSPSPSPTARQPEKGGCPVWEGRRLRSTNSGIYTVQYTLGLGRVWDNGDTDRISLAEGVLTPNSYTPDVLGFPVSTKGNTIEFVRDRSRPQRVIADPGEKGGYTSQSIKQIKVPEAFVDIVVLNQWEYEIRFYQPDQVGPKQDGFYTVTGVPSSVTHVRNPNPPNTNAIEITTTKDGKAEKAEWKYEEATDTWTYFLNGVESTRKSAEINPNDPCERIETRLDLKDGRWSKTIKVFKAFPWGQDIVKKIENPDGKARTTTYKYWDDPNGPHYTFLKTTIHPDGTIERHNRHPDPFKKETP